VEAANRRRADLRWYFGGPSLARANRTVFLEITSVRVFRLGRHPLRTV